MLSERKIELGAPLSPEVDWLFAVTANYVDSIPVSMCVPVSRVALGI